MKDLDEHGQLCEKTFGLISGCMLYGLFELSTAAGSNWQYDNPETIDIVVTKNNAASIYEYCKEIRSNGYSVGIGRTAMKKIKEARSNAHQFLWGEANDPSTSIERKIELVKLTSKSQNS